MSEDLFDQLDLPDASGIEITLPNDVELFKKAGGPNSRGVYATRGFIQEGETIRVGTLEDVVSFEYDHREQEFVPWLDDPDLEEAEQQREQNEMKVRYIKVSDIYPEW